MPDIPPIDDLENLSATGAMLEAMLRQWVEEIAECAPPDIVTLSEAIDFFTRLTAIRKTLIKLSRAPKPRPNNPRPQSNRSHSTDLPPVNLPEPNIDQIPCVPDVPYDQLRPQLESISAALAVVHPHGPTNNPSAPSAPFDPSDPQPPSSSHTSHNSHSSHSSHSSYSPHPPIRNPQSEIRNPSHPRRFG